MNPIMNTACTLRAGVMMPTMPVLQQPVYPNPNVPIYAPQPQPRPVPNPNFRPPNQGPNQQPNQQPNQRPTQRPNQQPNQYPNQGPQQPHYGNGQYNGRGQNGGGRPRSDFNNQNQNFGDKAYGDQIEDKFIPTVYNPYPAPIPGFYDINGMPCNPYMQTVYMQPPAVYQQPYVYQQSIVVG